MKMIVELFEYAAFDEDVNFFMFWTENTFFRKIWSKNLVER